METHQIADRSSDCSEAYHLQRGPLLKNAVMPVDGDSSIELDND